MKKILLLVCVCLFTGCGSSSPRFGASIAKEKTARANKQTVRPVTQEAKERAAEDDVKVDAAPILKKTRSTSRTVKTAARTAKPKPRTPVKTTAAALPDTAPHEDAGTTVPDAAGNESAAADTSAPVDQQKMMETIAEWLETPYAYGGDGNDEGIDCSAFTQEVFEQAVSITLPRSSAEQAQVGKRVQRDELKFGDLVFFKTRGRTISHVGIYLGDDLFAHASSGEGVTISSLDSTYFNKRYAAARRVLQ